MSAISYTDMVIMGDINLDWVCRQPLGFPFLNLVTNGVIEWTKIDELPGGSGLNFARYAYEAGYRPLLLGKIGMDQAGDFIFSYLKSLGLEVGICRTETAGTGKAFIARDQNGIRLLVNNEPNANRLLTMDDLECNMNVINSCKILYISGYCIMYPDAPRTQTTERLMEITHHPAKSIVFDVVPHQIYKIYPFDEFLRITKNVDILISEVATVRRYLGLGEKTERITKEMAEETVEKLAPYFDNFILRYGPSGCDEQVIRNSKKEELIWETLAHEQAPDKRGFGDRIAIATLMTHFGLPPAQSAG